MQLRYESSSSGVGVLFQLPKLTVGHERKGESNDTPSCPQEAPAYPPA